MEEDTSLFLLQNYDPHVTVVLGCVIIYSPSTP